MLVNCVVYQEGRKLADIGVDQIANYIGQKDSFIWVALKDPEPGEIEYLQHQFNLHELAVEDARHGHQSPKIEEYGDSLFVALHTVELGSDNQLSIGEVDIFVGSNYILSVRHRTQRGFAEVRARCEREPELLKNGTGFVLYALIDFVVDSYFPIEAHLERELEAVEERIFSRKSDIRTTIEEIYSLKHQLVTLQNAISPLFDAVAKLTGGRVPHVCQGMQEYFRDVVDHLTRIRKSIEKFREMTTSAMQVTISLIALSESEVSKKLASYGALFVIPTAVAGIYGMNFRHMPELNWTYGYPLILVAIILADVFLFLHFRRSGWL